MFHACFQYHNNHHIIINAIDQPIVVKPDFVATAQATVQIGTSSHKRPEVAYQIVPGECRLRLVWRCRLEIKIEPGCVPVASEIVKRLPTDYRPQRISVRRQPGMKLTFRPEGQDIRSREPDVIPEPFGRNEKVDDPISSDPPVANVEANGCA